MVSWSRADVVLLTAIELAYAAVKRVEVGAAPGSCWLEENHRCPQWATVIENLTDGRPAT